jgi:hypothetical protein
VTAAYVRSSGTGSSVSSTSTSFTIAVPAGGVPAGHTLLTRFAGFNGGGPVTITDVRSNTWRADFVRNNASTSGMNDTWCCQVATALQAGDLVTINYPAGNQNYSGAVDEFSGLTGNLLQVDAAGTGFNSGTAISETLNVTAASGLVVAVAFGNYLSTDSFTQDTVNTAGGDSWHGLTASYSDGSGKQASTFAAYKVITAAASQTLARGQRQRGRGSQRRGHRGSE